MFQSHCVLSQGEDRKELTVSFDVQVIEKVCSVNWVSISVFYHCDSIT